jgi:hypothetical protein
MLDYFKLQITIVNRITRDFGLPIFLCYAFLIFSFYGGSFYLFFKTEYANYLYLVIASFLLIVLSHKKRNEFLFSCFTKKEYQQIRLIENLIVSIPFVLFLLYIGDFYTVLFLILLSIILSRFSIKKNFNFTLPTPFSKSPFEFSVGFRRTFLLLILAYYITVMGVIVDNLSLGIFGSFGIAFIILSYFSNPEEEIFIWIYSCSPKTFLFRKIRTSLFYGSLLILPNILILSIPNPKTLPFLGVIWFILLIALVIVILAKYSAYPNVIEMPQAINILISVMFPLLFIWTIPMFYKQAKEKLKPLLND